MLKPRRIRRRLRIGHVHAQIQIFDVKFLHLIIQQWAFVTKQKLVFYVLNSVFTKYFDDNFKPKFQLRDNTHIK